MFLVLVKPGNIYVRFFDGRPIDRAIFSRTLTRSEVEMFRMFGADWEF